MVNVSIDVLVYDSINSSWCFVFDVIEGEKLVYVVCCVVSDVNVVYVNYV